MLEIACGTGRIDLRLDTLIDENMREPTLLGTDPTTQRRYLGEVLRSAEYSDFTGSAPA